ncbi:hypothetical protein ACHAXA_000258 [Cyclostephanos tholiformis]|uniref:Pentatricopeptide repeat-containing protein n=1 Tax=Cyclostephanos tholiformis TaxID=382380 RepID=A0ABD3SB84_9STRA
MKRGDMSTQLNRLEKAKLCSRIIEICLREVEARREFLWDWLQHSDERTSDTTGGTTDKFSPTAFWSETPHPTKEMFSLVFSSWRHVIESCSSFSIKSIAAMKLMESSAQQVSSLLSLMEDEYSSDAAFIHAYNSNVQKGSYTLLRMGAVLPDVRNYSEVIGTWAQCIDGSNLRQKNNFSRDGTFQQRLKLEATAMKSMMELLESMEEDLYENFSPNTSQRKRPPPDRICYNIILASMARQVNPSLYEMRLVLQRMMERVKYELESHHDQTEDDASVEHISDYAVTFFPDVYSYNALIEARANRCAMFASDKQQLLPQQLLPQKAWQQGNGENLSPRKGRFTSSEEEAILAEQILDEMCHLTTVSVRPNIYSFNVISPKMHLMKSYSCTVAVIKAWINADSERGLSRAVSYIQSLALNGHSLMDCQDEEESCVPTKNRAETNENAPTVFERMTSWGASLLSKVDPGGSGAGNERQQKSVGASFRSNVQSEKNATQINNDGRGMSSCRGKTYSQNQPRQVFAGVGMSRRLNYLNIFASESSQQFNTRDGNKLKPPPENIVLMNSAVQGNHKSLASSNDMNKDEYVPIGPLPNIEANVTPDLKTFQLVISALERHGTVKSAELAENLLRLLEQKYDFLIPDIAIYNSVLNAFAKAAKAGSSARTCLASAQRADELLCKFLGNERIESGLFPRPNEYSFLMVINAWSNATSAAVSAGNFSGGKNAAQHAEEVIKKLKMQALKTSKTTTACYGAVIRTWASLGEAERAKGMLEEMISISERLPLDPIHFNAVFDVCARDLASEKDLCKAISKLSSIHDILIKMDSRGGYQSINVDPDASSFNHVIRACYSPWTTSRSQDDDSYRQKAFKIAHDCYVRMSQDYNSSYRPDAHTFAHIFKAIACLHPSPDLDPNSDKYAICKTILHACCRGGHLTKSSLWTLRKIFPHEDGFAVLILSEMANHGGMNKEKLLRIPEERLFASLPEDWSRNGRNYKSLNRHRQ